MRGLFSGTFNKTVPADARARLRYQLLQAVYRGEHETVDALTVKGAKFDAEMLHAAVGLQDTALVEKCLQQKVRPLDETLSLALRKKDASVFGLLLKGAATLSKDVLTQVERTGTQEIKKLAQLRLRHS
ncbi:MAG: hypothetical protein OXT65_05720 [Alphaproteobacteria bacterium]|nr:hypothetical protein [Alphaproteobacteria bacterium]